MAWLCTRNDELKGTEMVIFTGNRLELGVSLCNRLRRMFQYKLPASKETVVKMPHDILISAYPAQHVLSREYIIHYLDEIRPADEISKLKDIRRVSIDNKELSL